MRQTTVSHFFLFVHVLSIDKSRTVFKIIEDPDKNEQGRSPTFWKKLNDLSDDVVEKL